MVLENIASTGQTTRRVYQRTLPSDPSKDYYFIHRNTGITEPLIVEYGFIDDTPQNVQFLNDNYKSLAEAVIKAITQYKNIPYYPPTETTTQTSTYIVQKGDTLYSISQKYNTTVEELKKLNNLTTNNISISQKIKVPSQNTYIVQPGDTLYKIATQNNTTVQIIKNLNQLTTNNLTIGQTLILPTSETTNSPSNETIYTVQKGDTLYSIAQKYNTTPNNIKNQNNLTTNIISIGQQLKISPNQSFQTPQINSNHTVQPGDTLYSIAKEYSTTVEKLKTLNNLNSNNLTIGQTIKTS